jgi:hypothetical protein
MRSLTEVAAVHLAITTTYRLATILFGLVLVEGVGKLTYSAVAMTVVTVTESLCTKQLEGYLAYYSDKVRQK